MRQLSDRGAQALIKLEGNKLKPYRDGVDLLTIGVGHLLTKHELDHKIINIDGVDVLWANGLTFTQSLALLKQDIAPRCEVVDREVPLMLTQNQFDTLVIFVFNIGVGHFLGSTLLLKIKAGMLDEVPAQLSKWNKAGGAVLKGLTNRRNAEIALWNTPDE